MRVFSEELRAPDEFRKSYPPDPSLKALLQRACTQKDLGTKISGLVKQ